MCKTVKNTQRNLKAIDALEKKIAKMFAKK
jgi:hypothetical protein